MSSYEYMLIYVALLQFSLNILVGAAVSWVFANLATIKNPKIKFYPYW